MRSLELITSGQVNPNEDWDSIDNGTSFLSPERPLCIIPHAPRIDVVLGPLDEQIINNNNEEEIASSDPFLLLLLLRQMLDCLLLVKFRRSHGRETASYTADPRRTGIVYCPAGSLMRDALEGASERCEQDEPVVALTRLVDELSARPVL
eukprot:764449-Hanusia_phi.AAC.7